jgi:DNA-binding NarL/FixJ family response regulator
MTISVFIAEDHAVLCDSLVYMLEAQHNICVVGCSYNGRDAVGKIARLQPNIATMDITMPLLNGIEATRELTQICPATQVIILTMYATNEYIYRALAAGARGYLLKNSAGKELVNAINFVFQGNRYLSRQISDLLVDDYVNQGISRPPESALDRLSRRESEVLQLVVEGYSTARIAEMLSLSPKTIDTYRSRLMNKLGIDDLPTLVKFAIRHGLISLD